MTTKTVIIAAILGLGVIVLIIAGFRTVKSKQKIKEKSDIEEKYSDYKYFREITQAEKHDLVPLDCSHFCPYFAQDGSVVIFASVPKGDGERDYVCYKLDKEGNFKDSLVRNNYKLESEYFINMEGYITWSIDGDKRVKAYRIINNEPWFNEQSFRKVYDEMYEKSDIVATESIYEKAEDDTRIEIERTFFFHDGEWCYIDLFRRIDAGLNQFNTFPLIEKKIFNCRELGTKKIYYSKGGSGNRTEMQTQHFSSFFNEEDGGISQLKNEHFQPIDFFREEYYRRRSASSFSPTGGFGSPNHWSGIGFIDLILNGDTLKIKMDMEEIARNNVSYSFGVSNPAFTLHYDEKVNFFILKLGDNYCYLIKPKIDKL